MSAALQVLQPSSVIDCAHYACKLSARACVLRQNATIKSRYGHELKAPGINSFCVTGECEQGRDVAIALTGQSLVPVRRPSGWRPQLKLVSPAPRPLERRRIAPLSTLPPAALEDIGEDLDEACAPPRQAPLPQHQLEQRRSEIAAAVLARREETAAVRPPPRVHRAKVSAVARAGAGEIATRSRSCAGRSVPTFPRASSAPCRRC